MPFGKIDDIESRFYAIDGSYNSYNFYNGLSIGLYRAGYVCFKNGRQIRMNASDDPLILGKTYTPTHVLMTNESDFEAIYEEVLRQPPIREMLRFFEGPIEEVFHYSKEAVCRSPATLFGFCQEMLEWALVFEVSERKDTRPGDFILRDGALRSLNIKQNYLVKLARKLHEQGIHCLAVTKQSPVKIELSYTFSQIDSYLQDDLRKRYRFVESDYNRQRLCCFFEVSDAVLANVYRRDRGQSVGMFGRKSLTGGRGFGVFFAARLDYVEKLQNYDWLIIDLNILDCIPQIEQGKTDRDFGKIQETMYLLTALTQEHSILGYPYPLVEAHNLVTIRAQFQEEIVARVKHSLYETRRMDHTEIENLFLDTHNRF